MRRWLPTPAERQPLLRPILVACLVTGGVTSLAALPGTLSTTSAALGYVLAVTTASVIAGLFGGLAASALAFLALNFFFTPPLHTFNVAKSEDLVALGVFLLVSAVVGTLLSSAVSQRTRSERREREAVILHHLGTRLLAGEPTQQVLSSFAETVTGLFGLARCEITTEISRDTVVTHGLPRDSSVGDPEEIPIVARGREVGRILAIPASQRSLGDEERNVIRIFAGQMGLALEGMRLAHEATTAGLDAETNRLRAALFSSVTHDLRTPLASITASVTTLMDGDLSLQAADRRELLDTIRHEAERLNRLVGNLLHLSRIRAGALAPVKLPVAIDELIEAVVARLQPVLDGHDVRLMFRRGVPDVPMDVVQIDQALTNLLENAAKYSPPGSRITVSSGRWQQAAEVRVVDEGPGIPPQERQRVFEPFARGEGRHGTGTGLGLSISRAIVESHGGKIWVEGSPGAGTTVVFQLPLVK